jgi:hypothetical protein
MDAIGPHVFMESRYGDFLPKATGDTVLVIQSADHQKDDFVQRVGIQSVHTQHRLPNLIVPGRESDCGNPVNRSLLRLIP